MSIADRVALEIPSGAEAKGYCDDCLTDILGLSRRQQVQRVTSALAVTPTYDRWVDECGVCHRTKLVTVKA